MDIAKASEWLKNYHRLSTYISSAMLYLQDNYLAEQDLKPEHIKNRILGHWGTVPGLNLIYGGASYIAKKHDKETMFIAGPGHGAPAVISGLWIEGTLAEFDPQATTDLKGLEYIIKQFSWPYGYPSHTWPGLPGSIHEGGELDKSANRWICTSNITFKRLQDFWSNNIWNNVRSRN
jgi:xylulose-5-phosphate/fructose-6-phosphate phosphoketolase